MSKQTSLRAVLLSLFLFSAYAWAGIDGSISGLVTDSDQVAVSGAKVQLLTTEGKPVLETTTDTTGNFGFFPVNFGSYQIFIKAEGYQDFSLQTTLTSSSTSKIEAHLSKGEMVVNVKAQRNLVQPSSSGSKKDIGHEQIETLPGGSNASLPKVLAETTPGIVQGPFGQTFIRGNHANIQYQIDGVQLPDSLSGTFGEAFSTRNIDHMEVITGGIPAEYGERMAAVVNIITKSGPEEPKGSVELNYGSYDTFNPQANFGGSDESGRIRYFATASYLQTERGLDTPQPVNTSNQFQGGEQAVHDKATGNDQFVHLDYIWNNSNKFSLNLFNETRTYEMPMYPSSFNPNDPYFSQNYTDRFGNTTGGNGPLFAWAPADTGDNQTEQNQYIELVWKKTLSDRSFLQITPYWKRSGIIFRNDPADDLASAAIITGATPTSFAMDRSVNNYGLKGDHTWRINDRNLVKSGIQVQQSEVAGYISTQTAGNPVGVFGTSDSGTMEAAYVQDSFSITKSLVLNAGLRYTAIQFTSHGAAATEDSDGLLQPRIGLEYMLTDTTKLHVFYGKLFMPAPFEDLRAAFNTAGPIAPYDLKGEKDDYYEAGVTQQIGNHVASLVYYYKDATNMLDETQIPNTAIDQPYNFATGYAQGVEFSVSGQITPHLSDFFNYSYEDAEGKGVSGGFFAFPNGSGLPPNTYQFLDHCQLDTANLGLTYKTDRYWITGQGLYGSGLRTGPNNTLALPNHASFDASVGYIFHGENWWSKWKASFDVTNITDNAYPIFIANGFNGSHYAAGREYFIRLSKEL